MLSRMKGTKSSLLIASNQANKRNQSLLWWWSMPYQTTCFALVFWYPRREETWEIRGHHNDFKGSDLFNSIWPSPRSNSKPLNFELKCFEISTSDKHIFSCSCKNFHISLFLINSFCVNNNIRLVTAQNKIFYLMLSYIELYPKFMFSISFLPHFRHYKAFKYDP